MSEERRRRAALIALGQEPPDPELSLEVEEAKSAAQLLAHAASPITPGEDLRARLMASARGLDPYAGFVDRLARMFHRSTDGMAGIARRITDPATAWEELLPGIRLLHFEGGAPLATADCGIVRMDPGATFPVHRHLGHEVSMILSGVAVLEDGRTLLPGDLNPLEAGSVHTFRAGPDEPLVFAAFVHEGFEVIEG